MHEDNVLLTNSRPDNAPPSLTGFTAVSVNELGHRSLALVGACVRQNSFGVRGGYSLAGCCEQLIGDLPSEQLCLLTTLVEDAAVSGA